jgi:hypothetical protein
MKKLFFFLMAGIVLSSFLVAFSPGNDPQPAKPATTNYIVIAWNDLGMHCANLDFSNLCILPPYNNQYAHVINVGDSQTMPTVLSASAGVYCTYEVPGNTYSVGKTNFWEYSLHLFGVTLPPNIGLTGVGLTGNMIDTLNYHFVEGIPITAYPDNSLTVPDPYQLTLIKAYNSSNEVIATTQSVIPVAHEINCVSSGCHPNEMDILNAHESMPGFNIANKPILCANCHADNALGMPGTPGTPSFSQAIHQRHGSETNDCYKCHPGPNTQCFRDVMHAGGMVCQDCHGSVSNVGNSIENGREPWLEEPSCGAAQCHGANYAEEPGQLFRHSKGHGGLYCSTCHGSPHAILPSENERDNVQNIALQGYAGTLKECTVCHGYIPNGPGPHGYNPLGIQPVDGNNPDQTGLLQNFPNPVSWRTYIPVQLASQLCVHLNVLDSRGTVVKELVNETLQAGTYRIEFHTGQLPSGIYYARLEAGSNIYIKKMIIVK